MELLLEPESPKSVFAAFGQQQAFPARSVQSDNGATHGPPNCWGVPSLRSRAVSTVSSLKSPSRASSKSVHTSFFGVDREDEEEGVISDQQDAAASAAALNQQVSQQDSLGQEISRSDELPSSKSSSRYRYLSTNK